MREKPKVKVRCIRNGCPMPDGSKPGVCDDCKRFLHNVFHVAKEALNPPKPKTWKRKPRGVKS